MSRRRRASRSHLLPSEASTLGPSGRPVPAGSGGRSGSPGPDSTTDHRSATTRRRGTGRAGGSRGSVETLPVALVSTLVVGGAVAAILVGLPAIGGDAGPGDRPAVLGVTAVDRRVELAHRGGVPLDVRELTVRLYVDGTPVERQPPVPFFSARGFVSGPTGPFNPAADPRWSPGETATLVVATTNDPVPAPGDRLTVVVRRDGRTVARVSTTVRRTGTDPDPRPRDTRPPADLEGTAPGPWTRRPGRQPVSRLGSRRSDAGVATAPAWTDPSWTDPSWTRLVDVGRPPTVTNAGTRGWTAATWRGGGGPVVRTAWSRRDPPSVPATTPRVPARPS